ncbi:unnamed protein product [Parascedosporium putredinis]|uniref:TAFII55 protein conserved region domain-containing protein n=1 Tax=Parascedosporium putredinis TaxID=1442378 RepID=A0A9P1H7D9_9PEZI|nr:unnamed protein product [Parascedosporium putredinis]CAI7998546.1 unnamed protein product [Parascedosporium putredinis]
MSQPEPQRPRLKISISNTRIPTARKIVFKGPQPATPIETPRSAKVATPSAKTKAGRQTKPTAKKREHDELGGDDTITIETQPKLKKRVVKLVASKGGSKPAPNIVIRAQGRPPVRPPGEGYDSEASDREDDPTVEEQIVLRMMPGSTAAISGKPSKRTNLAPDERVAPIDICQMLLVFKSVSSESEAKTVPLPAAVEPGFKWPHGLTPPMHDCVHRRFAKIISRKEIEDKEAEVERLLRLDRESRNSKWDLIDDRQAKTPGEMIEYEEDAEGEEEEVDYFQPQHDEFDATAAADLEADLEAAFEEAGSASPATQMEGEESAEDDDDDDDDDLDEEEQTRMDEVKGVRAIIADLQTQLKEKEESLKLPHVANSVILTRRVEATIRDLKSEIQLKMSSIGIEEEEEEEEED